MVRLVDQAGPIRWRLCRLAGWPVVLLLAGLGTACIPQARAPMPSESGDAGWAAYQCDGQTVRARAGEDQAELVLDGRAKSLPRVRSASGARYAATQPPRIEFWNKGDQAVLVVADETRECRRLDGPARPFSARGHEPGWALALAEGRLTLDWQYGEKTLARPLGPFKATRRGWRYAETTGHGDLTLALDETICHDSATGVPHPMTVDIVVGDTRLQGCGGRPENLLSGPPWRVEDLNERGVIDRSMLTLEFATDGTLAGLAGCNRYHGAYAVTGEGLSTGSFAATRKACAPALMNQEARFLETLQAVVRFSFSETGALVLETAQGNRILARR
jgi:heat shock protein HslJ/membrane-bound inhibitor of C-type lysozyme